MTYIVLCLAIVARMVSSRWGFIWRACITGTSRCGWKSRSGWLERLIYKICGIDPQQEMGWRGYAMAMLMLNMFGFLSLFALFTGQGALPLNPQKFPGLSPDTCI